MARPVVIVSFSYAPRLNPRAFRWTAVAEWLAARGHRVDVVSSWVRDAPPTELRTGVRIHRAGWPAIEGARAGMGGAVGGFTPGAAAGGGLRSLARRIWGAVCWPDVSATWYFPALSVATRLLRSQPGAALVSVAPAFTAVAIGAALKRRHPDVPWILDLGDPFSFLVETPPNNLLLYGALNRRFERSAFARAASVSVTNPLTARRYAEAFPESAGKLQVIPPLLSADLVPGASVGQDGCVRLVFIGTLYRGVREPQFLLELFARTLERAPAAGLELHFYGDIGACAPLFDAWRERCRGRLHVHGVVSRERALAATREAGVLVNLGNQTAFQLPSKVVEYAASGKPVLNVAAHDNDSSSEFFRRYPRALGVVATGAAPTVDQVDALVKFAVAPPAPVAADRLEAFLSPYRIESVAGRYRDLIEHGAT
ncbi:MAG: glycosyltransferase [Betaproteobacteria bacterium]